MRDKLRNLIAVLAAVGASLPWWWIIPSALALLGVAGSATAVAVAGWMSPALIGLSVGLLGRSFYVLYVQKRGSRPVEVLTWLSATFVIGFWTWRLLLRNGPWSMVKRMAVSLLIGYTALLLVGCGTRTASTSAGADSATPADSKRVTLHVQDMTKRLDLTWRGWPNRVEKALAGLAGVSVLDVDLEKDLVHISYDPKRVTPEAMVETVRREGFEANVVPGDP